MSLIFYILSHDSFKNEFYIKLLQHIIKLKFLDEQFYTVTYNFIQSVFRKVKSEEELRGWGDWEGGLSGEGDCEGIWRYLQVIKSDFLYGRSIRMHLLTRDYIDFLI